MRFCRLMVAVLCLCVLCGTVVSAADYMLLSEPQTRLLSDKVLCSYTPEGAMVLSSAHEEGGEAAIDLNLTVNLYETPFVQLSLTSGAPFNIAFKLNAGEESYFPQTAAPAWYEGFQAQAPSVGGGVNAGSYSLSLSIPAYLEYNGLSMPADGVVTLETVYIMLEGVGGLTLEHLMLSDRGEFQTAFGKTGQTAFSPIPITTADKAQLPTTTPTYDAGGVSRVQTERFPVVVPILLVLAAATVAVTVFGKRLRLK